jgi:iron complex outermembrane receptor protein
VHGNDLLLPERGDSAELGARFAGLRRAGDPTLWLDLSAFARRSIDLITYVRSAQGHLSPVNRESSRATGGEIALGASPLAGLETSAAVSLLDARDTSPERQTTNDVLPFISRATASALASYTRRFEGLVNEAGVSLRGIYQSSRYADPAGLGVIPAQTTVDGEAVVRLVERRVTARGRIANLFDAERFDVVGFPLPGRSGFFSVEATW